MAIRPSVVDNAKVMAKGQITIPKDVREKLHVNEGDRLTFVCQGDYAIVMNSAIYAMKMLQSEMKGQFETAGLRTEDDVNDLVSALRKENDKS